MNNKKGIKVCAVFVTYGDRYHLLKPCIEALLEQQISHIIVIDNHSLPRSHEHLKTLQKALDGKLEVFRVRENSGSAGGYWNGLQHASTNKECDFIWLLDDDNKPREGALKALVNFWQTSDKTDKEHRMALLSFREDREVYKEAVIKNKPDLVMGRKNSFLGFHMNGAPKELLRRLKQKHLRETDDRALIKKNHGQVSVAPFGGMFFHKTLLDEIGYPNRDFYLYADDWEFSYRVTQKGGKIILLLNSLIEDIEKSWHLGDSKGLFRSNLLGDLDEMRLYYFVRNRVYFEKKYRVTNPLSYNFNKFILLSVVGIFGFIMGYNNFKLIKKAVKDGNRGKLGCIS
jgi:GT2 family glycosyltransferase